MILMRDRSGRCTVCKTNLRKAHLTMKNGTIDDGENFYCSDECYTKYKEELKG